MIIVSPCGALLQDGGWKIYCWGLVSYNPMTSYADVRLLALIGAFKSQS